MRTLSLLMCLFVALVLPLGGDVYAAGRPPAVDVVRLKNGLTLLVAPDPEQPTFTATVLIRAGRAYEPANAEGAAETWAHLLLDGTSRMGTRDRVRERRIIRRLDALDARGAIASGLYRGRGSSVEKPPSTRIGAGGAGDELERLLDALGQCTLDDILVKLYEERGAPAPRVWVGAETIGYQVTLPANQLTYFLAVERARMARMSSRRFYLDREELALHRAREETNPSYILLRDVVAGALPMHPARRYGASSAALLALKRSALEAFRRAFIHPASTIIALTGGIAAPNPRRLVIRAFGDLAAGPPVPSLDDIEETPQVGIRRLAFELDAPPRWAIAFRLDGDSRSGDDPGWFLLRAWLGDPVMGPLAELRRKGLIRDFAVSTWPRVDLGDHASPLLLLIAIRPNPEISPEAFERAFWRRIDSAVRRGPTPEEFRALRRGLETTWAERLAHPASLGVLLARRWSHRGTMEGLTGVLDRLRATRTKAFQELAARILVPARATVGILGRPGGSTDTSVPLQETQRTSASTSSAPPRPRRAMNE